MAVGNSILFLRNEMTNLLNEKVKNILLLQSAIFLLSLGGIAAKKAAAFPIISINFLIYYSVEIVIIAIYAALWQQIIKKFELSVAYLNKGSLIIWTFIWAVLFFGETVQVYNVLGAILVISGIVMVFRNA